MGQSQDLEAGGGCGGDSCVGIFHHQRAARTQQLGGTEVRVWGRLQVGDLHSAHKRLKARAYSGAHQGRFNLRTMT